MFNTAIFHPCQAGVRAYVTNVGLATRKFVAALLAVTPRQSSDADARSYRAALPYTKVKSLWALYRMTNQYDSAMPDLSVELQSYISRNRIDPI